MPRFCGLFSGCLCRPKPCKDGMSPLMALDERESEPAVNPYHFVEKTALVILELIRNPKSRQYCNYDLDKEIEKIKVILIEAYNSSDKTAYFAKAFPQQDVASLIFLFERYLQIDNFVSFIRDRYAFENIITAHHSQNTIRCQSMADAMRLYGVLCGHVQACLKLYPSVKPPDAELLQQLNNTSLCSLERLVRFLAREYVEEQRKQEAVKLITLYNAIVVFMRSAQGNTAHDGGKRDQNQAIARKSELTY